MVNTWVHKSWKAKNRSYQHKKFHSSRYFAHVYYVTYPDYIRIDWIVLMRYFFLCMCLKSWIFADVRVGLMACSGMGEGVEGEKMNALHIVKIKSNGPHIFPSCATKTFFINIPTHQLYVCTLYIHMYTNCK